MPPLHYPGGKTQAFYLNGWPGPGEQPARDVPRIGTIGINAAKFNPGEKLIDDVPVTTGR
jgi:hypothetical protein